MHIEVVLDVAVAQHEVLADLNGYQVLRRQIGYHVDVLDVLVRILDVQVECLLVKYCSCSVLVLFSPPRPTLIMPFINATMSSECFTAIS
jgi:hypothetical protein